MTTDLLETLAGLAGIEPAYADIWGRWHHPGPDTKRAVLESLGLRAGTEAEIAATLAARDDGWGRMLEPVRVLREGEDAPLIPITLPQAASGALHWDLRLEDGRQVGGECTLDSLEMAAERVVDGEPRRRLLLALPQTLPLGYHHLSVHCGPLQAAMVLILAPERCYLPPQLEQGRLWGLSVQLYTLRSRRNWGIGDFGDLAEVAQAAAGAGASVLGLNPLHALFPDNPAHASPYSPSSRLFLNPLYLDVTAIEDFAACEPAQRLVASPVFQRALESLRQEPWVDYREVARHKVEILELLHRHFWAHRADDPDFAAFRRRHGTSLHRFAQFHALRDHFEGVSWRLWPEAFQDPDSAEVAAFTREHAERVGFYEYLQWQADRQLTKAAVAARETGMPVGLYRDLAVASDPNGADCWADRELVVVDADIGCPPDDFNPQGQNWGAPPLNPITLRERAYAPFVELLRANMRHAGALRIDHAMALMHLFWFPHAAPPGEGVYVAYPWEDLLGVLALESQRHRCLIVGEDLGTVPEGFRERMERAGILSYRLFYFERGPDGGFIAPRHYPAQALVTATTHDLPTLRGWWRGHDVGLRRELHLLGNDPGAYVRDEEEREADRQRLKASLASEGITIEGEDDLVHGLSCYLSTTPSKLLMIQLDDLVGETEPVNLPGTTDAYPNWRRRLKVDLEAWRFAPELARLAEDLAERSPGAAAGAE